MKPLTLFQRVLNNLMYNDYAADKVAESVYLINQYQGWTDQAKHVAIKRIQGN